MALVRREHFEFPDLWRRLFDPETVGTWLRVEEFVDGKDLVVRAEMPGIDPEHDVEVTIAEGVLQIRAKREARSEHKNAEAFRSEFRYGSFVRTVPLPVGASEEDVKATYADGILEIRVPTGEEAKTAVTRVPVTKA
ncbi:MAG TPA: Hsp20/alpha crystallin family protein [Acidimicrobiales bacterium]|nr:Hsp20/alpha crystallin family protein [Acidimicrobiales bacterium]